MNIRQDYIWPGLGIKTRLAFHLEEQPFAITVLSYIPVFISSSMIYFGYYSQSCDSFLCLALYTLLLSRGFIQWVIRSVGRIFLSCVAPTSW